MNMGKGFSFETVHGLLFDAAGNKVGATGIVTSDEKLRMSDPNATPEFLQNVYDSNDGFIRMIILSHPNVFFATRFMYELDAYPDNFPIAEFPSVQNRFEEYVQFLALYSLNAEDVNSMPRNWVEGLLNNE